MKLSISGIFKAKIIRDGKVVTEVETGNSLTQRGAFEMLNRFVRVGVNNSAADFYGGPIDAAPNESAGNIKSPRIFPILEAGFGALNRLDRIRHDDVFAQPIQPIDNRDWASDDSFPSTIDWGSPQAQPDLGNDYPPLITLALPGQTGPALPLPVPFVTEVTGTVQIRPGVKRYLGFYLGYTNTGGVLTLGRSIKAVLVSALLPEVLIVKKFDFVNISWTLKLSPTFP